MSLDYLPPFTDSVTLDTRPFEDQADRAHIALHDLATEIAKTDQATANRLLGFTDMLLGCTNMINPEYNLGVVLARLLVEAKLCVKCEGPIADPQLEGDERCSGCADGIQITVTTWDKEGAKKRNR